jgi:DNA-binding MarR family transcriptional regulator
MLDDYVVVASAAVIVAAVVILATLLYRYQKLVEEADKSSRLAKDVWDSVNSRFSVVDGRIIDLMAKTEVLSSRLGSPQQMSQPRVTPAPSATSVLTRATASQIPSVVASASPPPLQFSEGTETEARVLRFLVEGPRTSAQIKEEVGRSREHTARMLKALFDRGLVIRNDRNKPYVYEITDTGRSYVAS